MTTEVPHIPVMLNEVVHYLNAGKNSGIYVDCTFGSGGYSRAILNQSDSVVIAIDQDPTVKVFADQLKKEYPSRFDFKSGNFRQLSELVSQHGSVQGVVFDLGVSSMQLNDKDRGFSFQQDARLDMRMRKEGISAFEIINYYTEQELADIIYFYGEEPAARVIARNIVLIRQKKDIVTTFELADIIRKVVRRKGKIDPATLTFQAIRIATNDELNALKMSLNQLGSILASQARVVIVSFHGLEDKIIKEFCKNNCQLKTARSKYCTIKLVSDHQFKYIHKKAISPSKDEVKHNHRARSARLRVIEKVGL